MSDDSETNSWGLIVSFPDGSESFVNGFAAGQVWEAMSRSDPTIERTVREENEEVLRRMAHAEGYSVEWKVTEFGWADVILAKTGRSKDSAVAASHLTVIDGGKDPTP